MNATDSTNLFQTMSTLTDRLDTLERENNRLKWVAAALFVAVVIASSHSVLRKNKNVVARDLTIRDNHGNVRIELGLTDSGEPRLAMYGADGQSLLRLQGDNTDSASLTLSGQGKELVHLATGRNGYSSLILVDQANHNYSSFYQSGRGTTGLVMSHEVQGIQLGVQSDGISGIAVTDIQGIEKARLGNIPDEVSPAGLTHPGPKDPFRVVSPDEAMPRYLGDRNEVPRRNLRFIKKPTVRAADEFSAEVSG